MLQATTVKRTRVVVFALVLASVLVVAGCKTPNDIAAYAKPYEVNVTLDNYVLQPPDVIEVYCSKVPEINKQVQAIRPDGKISFEGLGELLAAGKTPAQVADMIRSKAAELYTISENEPLDVRVTLFNSKVYYVVGEVRYPGPKLYTGRDTVLRAIAQAHPEVTGWFKHIKVVRPAENEDSEAKIFEINLNKIYAKGDATRNVLLEEGDIVYVPPTPLAAVANVIAEFVRPIGLALSPAVQAYSLSN